MPKTNFPLSSLNCALVYDWADTNYGGAEQVLLQLHQLFPQAPLFVSFTEAHQARWLKNFPRVHPSFIQKFPRFLRRHKALLAPFLPLAFEQFDFTGFQLIISITTFAAKGILTKPEQTHLCHLLTPTRFLYSHSQTYRSRLIRWLTRPLERYLLAWDQVAATRPDHLYTNSRLVATRCQKYYQRPADGVIFSTIIPPHFHPQPQTQKTHFLCVGRLVTYKKIAQVVLACGQAGYPLKIIGTGPQATPIQRLIKKNHWQAQISLLGNLPPKTLNSYYNSAWALVAPAQEDFGINLLEANACGTWVITHPQSGARSLLTPKQAFDLKDESLTTLKAALATIRHLAPTHQIVIPQDLRQFDFKTQFEKVVRKLYAC